ncbi:MAG: endonuclease VII domain-containing protein [Acidobacteriota bacterium]|nr:endonuclease VII domain-containing protein [Acidobacteriota bacterium]
MKYLVKTRLGFIEKVSYRPDCKECKRLESRNRHARRTPEQNTNLYRKSRLKYNYGITLDRYYELLEKQNGVCAICGEPQNIETHSLSVDHCHVTGKVRGLLCHKCNIALGLMRDNVLLLINAIEYLR